MRSFFSHTCIEMEGYSIIVHVRENEKIKSGSLWALQGFEPSWQMCPVQGSREDGTEAWRWRFMHM